ncbi:ribosomal protein S20 [Thermodesulfatator indicus DSM 15286]|uniref:Small ribosomal subunit protein bS20 n=1 Tax=Thermodesulfatator indicus (strain DSM 15286 / JCM 11887 / CIR29812) TaxID=667014 RepID=F8ACZ8_THEID|nr:30S ribosomal protein S20 [Thermodesulfatator indicus]AEH45864.1 ribosomal protein S20 [Thermodesulfatator indicus DSM 15286]
MPQHRSAAKALRQSLKRRMRNKAIRSRVKTEVKKFLMALQTGTIEEAEKAFIKAQSMIQRAVSKGVLHHHTAARKISRLAAKLNAKKATAGNEA